MSFDHIAPIYNIGENIFFGNQLNLARTVFTDELMNSHFGTFIGGGEREISPGIACD